MHANTPQKCKASLLSLVSGIYSHQTLQDFGFQFSHTQYTTAIKKGGTQNFELADYQRSVPLKKVN